MEPIRVLIVDDQVITRRGLHTLLATLPRIEVVGEAEDGVSAIASTEELQPDVVLMDLRMPGLNGIEATRQLHRLNPHLAILVLTVFADDASVFPAIRAGARGYLLKNADQGELLRAIQTVNAGGVIFSPGIAERVLQYLSAPPPALAKGAFDELTRREREMLELVAKGLNNSEIADKLVVSPKTVSNTISNVLVKLQAADRTKLMLMAIEAGLGDEAESGNSKKL